MSFNFFLVIFYTNLFLEYKSAKLISLIDIFRHGPRTPLTTDNKTFKDVLNIYWGAAQGELTNIGHRQQFLSGLYIRDKYVTRHKLFSNKYKKSEFIMYCTDVNRTLISAFSKMEGIFYNKKLNNPIIVPVKSISYPSLHDFSVCPNINHDFEIHAFEPDIRLKLLHYKNHFLNSIWGNLRSKINHPEPEEVDFNLMVKIAEAVDVAYVNGKDLSGLKLTEENISFLREFKNFYSFYGRGSDEMIKLMSSPFLHRLLGIIDLIFSPKAKTQKYIGFSVHDASLITIFRVFGFIYPEVKLMNVLFSSQFNIEVYSNSTLTLLFNHEYLINVDYKEFRYKVVELVGHLEDFERKCGNINGKKNSGLFGWVIAMIFFFVFLVGVFGGLLICSINFDLTRKSK